MNFLVSSSCHLKKDLFSPITLASERAKQNLHLLMFDGSEMENLIEDWLGYIPRLNNMVIPARDNCHFLFDASRVMTQAEHLAKHVQVC